MEEVIFIIYFCAALDFCFYPPLSNDGGPLAVPLGEGEGDEEEGEVEAAIFPGLTHQGRSYRTDIWVL